MDTAVTVSVRCAAADADPLNKTRQCGREREYSELVTDPQEVVRNVQVRAEAAFAADGWVTGKPKDCRCPDHA